MPQPKWIVMLLGSGRVVLIENILRENHFMKGSSFARPAVAQLLFCAAVFMLGDLCEAETGRVGYPLIKTIPLPPAPGDVEYFDYITVDAEARRVYVRTEPKWWF